MNDGTGNTQSKFERLFTLLPRHAVIIGSIGLVDQAIISGVSFILMVATARLLGPASFGIFSLLYAGMLLAYSAQNALITSPLNVIGATKSGDEFRRYASSVGVLQLGLAAVFLLLCVIAAIATFTLRMEFGWMLLALGFAILSWQLQEYTRRVMFTQSRYASVLWNDLLTHGLRLVGLLLLWSIAEITGSKVFLLMGSTWSFGALVGAVQMRDTFVSDRNLGVWREHWRLGRWLFASEMVTNIPRYVSAAVLASLLSVSAYGAYRAFSQIVQGSNVPLQAMNSLVRPKLARDAQKGTAAVWYTMRTLMQVGGLAFSILAASLLIFRVEVSDFVFGDEYRPYSVALVLLSFVPLITVQRYIIENGFQAVRHTRPVFVSSVIGVSTGVLLGTLSVAVFGLPAAGAIHFFTVLLTAAPLWVWWKRRQASARHSEPDR